MHSRKQRIVFYQYINENIKNPHLTLYLRSLLEGEDIQFKRYLKGVSGYAGLTQRGYELLWAYVKLTEQNVAYLNNTLDSITLTLNKDGWEELVDELQGVLTSLGLPRLE